SSSAARSSWYAAKFSLVSHSKWQANKYKASRCPIFSDMSVKAILWLQADNGKVVVIKLCGFLGSCSFSISGNSKPGEDRREWQAAFNRHSLERICKLRTAVTAHSVGLVLQCEHTAEVNMVTPKEEIKDS